MSEMSQSRATVLFITGCVTFPGALLLLQRVWFNTAVGAQIRKRLGFTDKDCTDISVKAISAGQAVLASVAGLIVCSNCYRDVMYDSHPMTLDYAWFGIPYFVYDTFAMFYASEMSPTVNKRSSMVGRFFKFIFRSPIIVIHHMILAPIGFGVLVFARDGIRNGDFFMGVVYMMEISTPFVSFRYILSKFKLKTSPIYNLNGIMMIVLFPVFRIWSIFYTAKLYGQQNGMSFLEVLWEMPSGWKFIFMAAIAPQIYWYSLMCNGLFKMLRPSSPISNAPRVENGAKNGVETSSPSSPPRPNSTPRAKEE